MVVETLILGFQAGFGAAILRNMIGYVKKITEDGKVTKYELAMLGTTAVTNIMYSMAFILMGMSPEVAMGLSVLTDVGVNTANKMV